MSSQIYQLLMRVWLLNTVNGCLLNMVRSSHQRCSIKNGVLRNFAKFTGKHLCQSLLLMKLRASKETLAQMYSSEFCEISKNTFFT